jgi:L-alanine-DL-glutamate epimerase-like enolase superfamily enzyme
MPPLSRRTFIRGTMAAGAAATLSGDRAAAAEAGLDGRRPIPTEHLDARASDGPVLRREGLDAPVRIESLRLLRAKTDAGPCEFVRVRSEEGAEGYSVPNFWVADLHPVFRRRVAPYFVGKDARNIEALVDGVSRHQSNYKLQSLGLWCPVAWVEFAVLDMLGRMLNQPVGELMGGVLHREIAVYPASGNRGNPPEAEVEFLGRMLEETGCRAVKFRVGGRMSGNADSLPGRSEALIPLARARLGDEVVLFADANSSYDAANGIRLGRLLEAHGYGFFEEPCRFDWLDETAKVTAALDLPVAWGEQESSYWAFRWMISNHAVDIVQPDLHYYGGFIRTARVARMCQAAGLPLSLHLSGGLGYSQMIQFTSCMPNLFGYQEYKGDVRRTGAWFDPPIVLRDGKLSVPTAPGFGMVAAPELTRDAAELA